MHAVSFSMPFMIRRLPFFLCAWLNIPFFLTVLKFSFFLLFIVTLYLYFYAIINNNIMKFRISVSTIFSWKKKTYSDSRESEKFASVTATLTVWFAEVFEGLCPRCLSLAPENESTIFGNGPKSRFLRD